ncbi:helix-turn-helix domain-containing protein [Herbidospora mongoliensis]|uniref:helix-turn-helix domain-containing protein n=1 Tax=Herbidospora mongoliensis TaxID=688067 RepID=UPI000831FCD4|nr:XRE family transcriptional regulator [Herbidospora mongoliensis]
MKDPEQWADVGERVRECRVAAGLSQEDLARALSLDRTMIAKIEIGVRRVDALELLRLSDVLDIPLDFLVSTPPAVISRRVQLTEDTATDAGRNAFRLQVALTAWAADIRQLIDLGVLSPPPVVDYSSPIQRTSDAREAARWVRQRLGLNARPIESLIAVCEEMGQLIAVVDLPGDGASMIEGDVAAAVVSRQGDPGRRRATAAHELGHLIIGDEYSSDIGISASRSDRETVIDAFAAELLVPIAAYEGMSRDSIREGLMKVAAHYRASWSLVIRQATEAGFLDREQVTNLRRRTPTRAELLEAVGWAPQPDLESIRVSPRYAHAVLEAYRRQLVTASRAVEMMRGHLTEEDLPLRDDGDSVL